MQTMMKKVLCVLLACFVSQVGLSADRVMEASLDVAIELAQKEDKLLFIKYGREKCGNCQHLGKLIDAKDVRLSKSDFVLVEMDCDDKEVQKTFWGRYREAFKDAKTLPFVVVARPDGSLVDSISGYQDTDEYNKFVRKAKAKSKKI